MSNSKRTASMVAMALLVVAYFVMPPPAKAASIEDSVQISKLLADAKTESVELKHDALEMESFTRSKLSWESHATAITRIKGHINKVGELVTQLNDARHAGSPWQQDAIDRITPLLRELAANTESTIEHLNNNRNRLHTTEYKNYVVANYDLASDLAALIGDFVDYGKAKEKFETLQQKLETN
ncbi:MAG TPA: hypothetical protein VEU62_11680 [Bryobacterales bacterium]|nr:hypothetical protein [Bryobacterales bacterium]